MHICVIFERRRGLIKQLKRHCRQSPHGNVSRDLGPKIIAMVSGEKSGPLHPLQPLDGV